MSERDSAVSSRHRAYTAYADLLRHPDVAGGRSVLLTEAVILFARAGRLVEVNY